MPLIPFALWIANVALETAGQLLFKSVAVDRRGWSAMIRTPLLWIGIVCFAAEFFVWFALISVIPLSQAMLVNSIQIVAVMLAARVVFGEKLDVMRVLGASLVSIGVALAGAPA